MVDAYLYAENAPDDDGNRPPIPRELVDLEYIDRFGVQAVYGRETLSYGEIRRMTTAENVKTAYLSRKASNDWMKWAAENPQAAALLASIEKELDAD